MSRQALNEEINLPHLQSTFLDYPSCHHRLHHPHLRPQVAQTQSSFANIPPTTCMRLDTPRCHSELLNMAKKHGDQNFKLNYNDRNTVPVRFLLTL